MTENEVLKLLDDITTMYPLFIKDRDLDKLCRIWQECLAYQKAEDMHTAFICYCKEDRRNVPPTPGNLIDLIPPDQGEYIE